LYLEDDFQVNGKIDIKDSSEIINFVKQTDPDIYGLGNFAIPKLNYLFRSHQKMVFNMMALAHCVMYNTTYMKKQIAFCNNTNTEKMAVDIINVYMKDLSVYRYYKPLVYQIFPPTLNQTDGWSPQIGSVVAAKCFVFFLKLLKLDTQIEPGYTIIYNAPILLYFLSIFISMIIIRWVLKVGAHICKSKI
jgi:hypothetical protein